MGGETIVRTWGIRSGWVYPRVGGETHHLFLRSSSTGSIPAWAGKPCWLAGADRLIRVYPRVGGETSAIAPRGTATQNLGLSPRGRGKPVIGALCEVYPRVGGETPGRAATRRVYPRVGGETSDFAPHLGRWRVYPRVGGERHRSYMPCRKVYPRVGGETICLTCILRVYPRVGGETRRRLLWSIPVLSGLSPRGRGNRFRFVSAWASQPRWVYPRVGGETAPCAPNLTFPGLSPRLLLSPRRNHLRRFRGGSIPAWAGKPTSWCAAPPIPAWRGNQYQGVYPRVGGETGPDDAPWPGGLWSVDGSIPAWAGKPRTARRRGVRLRVYPRVGGETRSACWCGRLTIRVYPRVGGGKPRGMDNWGLSPRGRGNRAPARTATSTAGSIPAWAGKPPTATTATT